MLFCKLERPSRRYEESIRCHMAYDSKSMPKLSPAACFLQSLWQSTSSYQEVNWRISGNELWKKFNCLNDVKWHLADEFIVKFVLPGKFSLMCDSESQFKPLNPKFLMFIISISKRIIIFLLSRCEWSSGESWKLMNRGLYHGFSPSSK